VGKRSAETDGAERWNRQKNAFRHRAVKVFQIDRDELNFGKFFHKPPDSAFKRPGKSLRGTGAFGKDYERITCAEGSPHGIERIFMLGAAAVHEYAAQLIDGDPLADTALPVISGGNRPCLRTQLPGQRRPDDNRVKMTGVIGKINALFFSGAQPIHCGYAPTSRRVIQDMTGMNLKV